jgi:hypothetical protein
VVRGGAGLSEIEIAVAVFLPGVTAQRRCMGPLNRFWHRTASIGPIIAPLIPQLGIASLRVAGSTVKSKKLGQGVEIELQGQPVQETSAGNSWRRSDLRRQTFGRFHGLYSFFVSCNTAGGGPRSGVCCVMQVRFSKAAVILGRKHRHGSCQGESSSKFHFKDAQLHT